jgi:hypothetical protein
VRVGEERVERIAHVAEALPIARGDDAVVPLDAGLEGAQAEVRAADKRRSIPARSAEDVALGVGARTVALEDAKLGTISKVEQAKERVGFSYAEVVAGEEPNATFTSEHIAQIFLEFAYATRHRERDRDVHLIGVIEVCDEVRKERVVGAADDRPVMRRPFYRRREEVVAAAGHHVAHAAARVGDVAGITRDDVEVEVIHRLPRCGADVQPEVVAVG